MTDLRNVTVIGMMARLNTLLDEGASAPTPAEVKKLINEGTILARLCSLYGEYPEFSPIHKAEAVLLRQELKTKVEKFAGREDRKMGVKNNGLCLLLGYCLEVLAERNLHEIMR
jgi:hypothetical protein